MKKSMRDLNWAYMALERQEKTLIMDIKSMAKTGQMDVAKTKAKDLVRTRGHIKGERLQKLMSQMMAMNSRLPLMKSSQELAQAMWSVSKMIGRANAKVNLPQLQSIMQAFEKQSTAMGMKKEEMVQDESVADDEDEDEWGEHMLGPLLAELGVDATGTPPGAADDALAPKPEPQRSPRAASPRAASPRAAQVAPEPDPDHDAEAAELQQRLANLAR